MKGVDGLLRAGGLEGVRKALRGAPEGLARELVEDLRRLEVARRLNPMAFYRPNRAQEVFHRGSQQIRVVQGGNKSGKTYCGVWEDQAWVAGVRGWWPVGDVSREVCRTPSVVRVVAEDYPVAISQVVVPLLEGTAARAGNADGMPWIEYPLRRNQSGMPVQVRYSNGSVINLLAYTKDVRQHESADSDAVHFDEPPPRPIFMANRRGIVARDGRMWVTMTPIDDAWVCEELGQRAVEEPGRVLVVVADIRDNLIEHGGVLTRRQVEEFERDLTPEEREARIHGRPMQLMGRVFKEYHDRGPWVVPDREIPREWLRVMAIDPHPEKAFSHLWVAVDPLGFAVVYDELEDADLVQIEELAEAIRGHEAAHGQVVDRLIDTLAHSPERTGGGITIAQKLADLGIVTRGVSKVDKWQRFTLTHSLFKVDERFGRPRIQVMERCHKLRQELRTLTWDRAKMGMGGQVRKKLRPGKDDLTNCLMYVVDSGVIEGLTVHEKIDKVFGEFAGYKEAWAEKHGIHTGY